MASKIDKADAQEWLESLQQVGEGWWRQVALAAKAGAPKALGLTRREFAQEIGQRLIDPRDAVLELHREGHTKEAIADVLGISKARTHNILVEEGVIEGEHRSTGSNDPVAALASGTDSTTDAVATPEEQIAALQAEVEELGRAVQGERAKGKRDLDAAKEKLKDLRAAITEVKRQAKKDAEAAVTQAERDRLGKEAEAWANEQSQKVLAGLAHLVVDSIVGSLEEAAGEVRLLIEQDTVTEDGIRRIESAKAGFDEEFNVARMAAAATH